MNIQYRRNQYDPVWQEFNGRTAWARQYVLTIIKMETSVSQQTLSVL